MKRLIIMGMCLFCLVGVASADVIKIGFFELAPHAMQGQNEKHRGSTIPFGFQNGVAIELVNQVAKKMGHTVAWYGALPFPRLIEMLKKGELDGATVLSKNSDREQFLHYAALPMFTAKPVMVVPVASNISEIKSVDDIAGWKVGFLKGGHTSPFIKNNLDKIKMDLIGGNAWVTMCLKKMFAGRINGVYDLNQYTVPYYAVQMNKGTDIKVLNIPDKSAPLYVAFSKSSPNGAKYVKQFNDTFTGFDYDAGVKQVK
jgi:ABC-type amino acid transport substrate-binding protein